MHITYFKSRLQKKPFINRQMAFLIMLLRYDYLEPNPVGEPILSIAHLKPILSVDKSSFKNLLVPGCNQYALSFQEPPLYTLE